MTKDEALKLALEWAEARGEIVFAGGGMDAVNKMNSWVTAIKKALAQPEQEPVAWVWVNNKGWLNYGETPHDMFKSSPLYTHPPQRSESSGKPAAWVGLTNNDLQPIAEEYRILFGSWVHDFARAIEAKLREKNT